MTVEVGWCWTYPPLENLGFEPEKLKPINGGSKFCPAVSNQFKNAYTIKSPYTLNLKFRGFRNGNADINLEDNSSIILDKINDILVIKPTRIWEDPQTPTLQMHLGILFVTDTKGVELEMLPPFLEYRPERYPVITSAIKFNIYDWVKDLQLGYHWKDLSKNLHIQRGDVLSYIRFNRDVKLKQIEYTPELEKVNVDNSHSIKVAKGLTRELMQIAGLKRKRKWL